MESEYLPNSQLESRVDRVYARSSLRGEHKFSFTVKEASVSGVRGTRLFILTQEKLLYGRGEEMTVDFTAGLGLHHLQNKRLIIARWRSGARGQKPGVVFTGKTGSLSFVLSPSSADRSGSDVDSQDRVYTT